MPSLEWGWGRRFRVDAAAAEAAGVVVASSDAEEEGRGAAPPVFWRTARGPGDAADALAPAVVHPAAVAYLAQHTLFDQVPALLDDLELPVYAEGEVGSINAWFGTAGAWSRFPDGVNCVHRNFSRRPPPPCYTTGTVTRCHFDTYENLLTQASVVCWRSP